MKVKQTYSVEFKKRALSKVLQCGNGANLEGAANWDAEADTPRIAVAGGGHRRNCRVTLSERRTIREIKSRDACRRKWDLPGFGRVFYVTVLAKQPGDATAGCPHR